MNFNLFLKMSLGTLILAAITIDYCACAPRSYYYDYPTRPTRPTRATSARHSDYGYYYGSYYNPNSIAERYHSNRYRSGVTPATSTTTTTTTPAPNTTQSPRSYRISRADQENAKFAGTSNQELEDLSAGDEKSLLLKKKLLKKKLARYRPCLPFGRAATNDVEQGRFLFDLNVYNVYPYSPAGVPLGGCGGFGGGGGGGGYGYGLGGGGVGFGGPLGGGLLSDPIAAAPYRPITPFATWLSLFAPGILQNSLAATVRPPPYRDPVQPLSDAQNDPEVDSNYTPQPLPPVRRPPPNRVYYDSAGASPITPAQLVGGVATTVNGIIQQLTGNVQPVYSAPYRTARSYG